MNATILLASTFILVFALGLQSQLVNNGHYIGAFVNSVLISVSNLGALQIVGAHTGVEYAAYILGGPVGIVCSMVMYRRFFQRTKIAPTPSLGTHPVQAELIPPVRISEPCGGEWNDLRSGQGYVRGWNECRAAMVATLSVQTQLSAPVGKDSGRTL
jgi:hypothetical protein